MSSKIRNKRKHSDVNKKKPTYSGVSIADLSSNEESSADEITESGVRMSSQKSKAQDKNKKPAKKKQKLIEGDSRKTVRLYVGNISSDTTEEKLSGLLGAKTIQMAKHKKTGANLGFAFITVDAARRRVVLKKNGIQLNGQHLKIQVAQAKDTSVEKSSRLHVSNLQAGTTEEVMTALFGNDVNVTICCRGPANKCYAFLDFHSTEAAQKALRSHQGHKVKGQKIHLAFAAEPTSNQPYKVLKIRGLPPKSTVQSVKKLLPTASSAHMPTNASTHKHKGFIFVVFKSTRDALVAKNSLSGKRIDGAKVHINFAAIPDRSSWLRQKKKEEYENPSSDQEGYKGGDTSDEEEDSEGGDSESEAGSELESGDDRSVHEESDGDEEEEEEEEMDFEFDTQTTEEEPVKKRKRSKKSRRAGKK